MMGTGIHIARRACALLLLAALAFAGEQENLFDAARLQARLDRLKPLVEKELGVELGPVEVRAVVRDDLCEVLLEELKEQFSTVEDLTPEQADAIVRQGAMLISRMGLGKTTRKEQVVMVCPENIRFLAGLAPEYAPLEEPGFLDLVLIHELAHVVQFRLGGGDSLVARCRTSEQLRIADAILEGHAQYVTRGIASANGLAEEFDLFVTINTTAPSSVTDPGLRQVLELLGSVMGFSYVQGEKFVTAVIDALGREEGERRLFSEPPGQLRLIGQPELYLDPSLDAPPTLDMERCRGVLQRLWVERFGPVQVLPLTQPTVQAALAGLGPEEAARGAKLIRDAFVVAAADNQSLMVAETASPEAARDFVSFETRLLHARDELFSAPEGALRIAAAEYEDLDGFGLRYAKQVTLRDAGTTIHTSGAAGAHGSASLEVVLIGEEYPKRLAVRLAREAVILMDAMRHDAPWTGLSGEEASAAVLAALDHPDPAVRWRAVRNTALARIPVEEKRSALVARLRDPDGHVRAAAVRLLLDKLDWEDRATEADWDALGGDDDFEIAWLILSRVDWDTPEGAAPLTRAALRLLQRSPRVLETRPSEVREFAMRGHGPLRVEAVLAVHASGDRSAEQLGALLDALGERMAEDGERLIAALGEWPAADLPDRAVALLVAGCTPGRPDAVRRRAARTIGALGGRARHVIPDLEAIASDETDPLAPAVAEAAAALRRAVAGDE